MRKPLMDRLINEVGDLGDRMMLGLPYTAGGSVINVGVPTPSSPDNTQNPDEFATDGTNNPDQYKDVEPDNNSQYSPDIAGSQRNVNVGIPDENTQPNRPTNTAANPTNYDTNAQSKDLTDTQAGINDIKYKVTPDEVIQGINAELKSAVFKRPDVAKALVIKNLRKDPKYYSKLKFLNVDDSLDESFKNMTPQQIAIAKIVREMHEKKKKRGRYE